MFLSLRWKTFLWAELQHWCLLLPLGRSLWWWKKKCKCLAYYWLKKKICILHQICLKQCFRYVLFHAKLSIQHIVYLLNYRVIQILRAASDGCRSRPWVAHSRVSGPSVCRCFQTLTVLFQFIFRVDGRAHRHTVHLQSGNISVYWLWLLLDVSAVSVVIMIIAICDMPRQEFSLCEGVYIHNTYQ